MARVEELARDSGEPAAAVEAGLRRLHEAHALVLERGEPPRIRMLNPFSAVPTAFRVHARDAWWYAWGDDRRSQDVRAGPRVAG